MKRNENFFKNAKNIQNFNNNNNNMRTQDANNSKVLIKRLRDSRISGIINITNLNLSTLPKEIFHPNIKYDDINWWEMVDLQKLDASNNKITDLTQVNPNDLTNSLISLLHLKLSNNLFKSIANDFFSLTNLKSLDLSNNQIESIDPNISLLTNLVELSLSFNKIKEIPNSVGNLSKLEILNLNNNFISKICFENFEKMFVLKRVNFSNNLISSLNSSFENNQLLEEIDFSVNKIDKIYENEIIFLKNLKFFDFHQNSLTIIESFPMSNKLDSIILGFNKLKEISNISNSPNVSVLDLNNNKIQTFPKEILQLNQLKTLNLQNNDINDIPPEMALMKNLVRANFEGNPLKKIPNKLKSANTELLKAYLKNKLSENPDEETFNENKINFEFYNNSLILQNLNLLKFPSIVDLKLNNLNSVSVIDVSFNKIDCIDDSIMNDIVNTFVKLKEFKANHNFIKSISNYLIAFNNLRVIELNNNKLQTFLEFDEKNEFFGSNLIFSLEYLDLSFNKFQTLPSSIVYFKNLKTFLFSNNLIKNINELTLSNSTSNLETIDFSNNKIEILPEQMFLSLPSLKSLNLENNNITALPTDFGKLSLTKLYLYGNVIKSIRSNLINGPTAALLDYLNKRSSLDNDYIETNNFIKHNSGLKNLNTNYNNNAMMVQNIRTLDEINYEIIEMEAQINNCGIFSTKAALKKKYMELLRERSKLLNK